MIAKINKGANLYGALAYNYRKVLENTAYVLDSNRIIQNMNPEKDLHLFLAMQSFQPYLDANPNISKPVVHISINPAPEDKLTDEQYILLAKEYLEKMEYGDQPYLIYKHQDIDRHHIHIVTVRIKEDGKTVRDNMERIRNKMVCRELEEKYHLALTTNRKQTDYFPLKVDYQKGDIKRQLSNTLKTLLESYKFHSFGEWNALLSVCNIHSEVVKGEEEGRIYRGIVYSATDNKGEIKSSPVKSSRIGKFVGYDALEKLIQQNTATFKKSNYPQRIKKVLSATMNNATDLETFRKLLKKNNIDLIVRQNATNRITGVTFIDHKEKLVYNGSRIGKEFSANALNDKFNLAILQPAQPEFISETVDTELVNNPSGTFALHFHGEDLEAAARKKKRKRRRKKE